MRVGLVIGSPATASRSSGGRSAEVCTTTPMRRTLRSRGTVTWNGRRSVNPSKPCRAAAVGPDTQHGSPTSSTSATEVGDRARRRAGDAEGVRTDLVEEAALDSATELAVGQPGGDAPAAGRTLPADLSRPP